MIRDQRIKEKPNNYAFIDSQNLYLGIKSGHGWKLDYKRFRVYLKDKYNVIKTFLFIGYLPGNEALYTSFQKADYIVIFKPTLELKDGTVKGNVDAELVLHTMIEFDNFDKAVLVSGDGDFHCLIEYLVKQNKFVKLLIPNKYGFSALLRKFRPFFVFIDELREKLEFAGNKKRGSNLRTKP